MLALREFFWEDWPVGEQPPQPTPDRALLFVDTISRRRLGASHAIVVVEADGDGRKKAGQFLVLSVPASATGQGLRQSWGKSYADLRPYPWSADLLNKDAQGSSVSDNEQEEALVLEHYLLSVKES